MTGTTPRRRRRAARLVTPVVAVAVLVGLTLGLARTPAGATFTATTADTGNKVTTANTFCASPGSASLTVHDTWVDQSNPSTNHQSDSGLHVRSSLNANARIWLLFDLDPTALPHDCAVTAATLQLYDYSLSSGSRTIVVNPATATWAASSITWSNQPGYSTGSSASSTRPTTARYQSWDVKALVQAQYNGTNYGFVVRDQTENAGTAAENIYYDKNDASDPPTLVVTWG